ncbi:MAG: hypothetical protein ABWX74_21005 [Aeromicrobium sp.]
MSSDSLSVYEAWVRTLRAWQRDSTTDLTGLPVLDETSFPPATYQRLIRHLNDAVTEHMRRWQEQLGATLGPASSDHEKARALVDARVGLGQRIMLARHTSFPEKIRQQLMTQAETDIRGLQAQLEEQATHVAAAGSATSRPQREATLKLFRDNALTAVLDPGFAVDGTIDDHETRRAAAADADVDTHAGGLVTDVVRRRPTRRIFNPADDKE